MINSRSKTSIRISIGNENALGSSRSQRTLKDIHEKSLKNVVGLSLHPLPSIISLPTISPATTKIKSLTTRNLRPSASLSKLQAPLISSKGLGRKSSAPLLLVRQMTIKKGRKVSSIPKKCRNPSYCLKSSGTITDSECFLNHVKFKCLNDTISERGSLETSSDEIENYFNSRLLGLLLDTCEKSLMSLIDDLCFHIVTEAYSEMINAAMMLFASQVLDKYLRETVQIESNDIVFKEFNLAKEEEYVDSQVAIISKVFDEELKSIINKVSILKISESFTDDMLEKIPLDEYVKESISEEIKGNRMIINLLTDAIFEEFYTQDWLDIIVEDEVSAMKLEAVWELLPRNMQREFNIKHNAILIERLAEYIYYDYLNEIVGGTWASTIANSCLDISDEPDTETIMPIRKFQRRLRAATSFFKIFY